MLNCALVAHLDHQDKRAVREGMCLLASLAHQHQFPVSWSVLSTDARSYSKDLNQYQAEFGDEVMLALDTVGLENVDLTQADQIVSLRHKLPPQITAQKERLRKALEGAPATVASVKGIKNHVLVEALEATEFSGLYGYDLKANDAGCPFGFFYPAEDRHNFANQPSRSVVGIPANVDLVERVLAETAEELLGLHLVNLDFNQHSHLIFSVDVIRLANLVNSRLDLLADFLEILPQMEQVVCHPLGGLVDAYRASASVTTPTYFLEQPSLDESSFRCYDNACQLVFQWNRIEPVEIYNYISPPIGSYDGSETTIPEILDFKSSRSRSELRMTIEIESGKAMPYGCAVWGDHVGLGLVETNALSIKWIADQLLLVRTDLEYGQNTLDIRLTI